MSFGDLNMGVEASSHAFIIDSKTVRKGEIA
jgi:hypothetical protein